jgi:hypothetical protein
VPPCLDQHYPQPYAYSRALYLNPNFSFPQSFLLARSLATRLAAMDVPSALGGGLRLVSVTNAVHFLMAGSLGSVLPLGFGDLHVDCVLWLKVVWILERELSPRALSIFLALALECPCGLVPCNLVRLYAICRQKRWGINGAFTQRLDSEPPFIFCTKISHLLCYIPSNHIKVEDKPEGSYLHGYTFLLTIAFVAPSP